MQYHDKETKMKKLLAVLVGVFCLGATSVFAQTRPETTQEKIVRLEVENASLKAQVVSLTNAQSQPQNNAPQAALTNTLKPYYANLQIQQLCEQFDAVEGFGADKNFKIDTYMKRQYMKGKGKEVINAEMQVYTAASSVVTGRWPRTVYQITLTIKKQGATTIAHTKTYKKWVYGN